MPKWQTNRLSPGGEVKRRYNSRIIACEIEVENRRAKEKKERQNGPRGLYFQYLEEDGMSEEEAIKEIQKKYPHLTKEMIMAWKKPEEMPKKKKAVVEKVTVKPVDSKKEIQGEEPGDDDDAR